MSLLNAVTGPTAQIVVGSGGNSKAFNVHKKLLCDSSTYFKAALTNGFAEMLDQKITLDDKDPAIFRTYVVWLYKERLDKRTMPPDDEKEALQKHMLELYIFADKRGITNLLNDTITMLASRWAVTNLCLNNMKWLFPLISDGSKLYQLIVDNAVLELRNTLDIRRRLIEAVLHVSSEMFIEPGRWHFLRADDAYI